MGTQASRGNGSNHAPVTSFFLSRPKQANHVLVGTNPAQIRFAEQTFETTLVRVDRVTDADVEGHHGLLLGVYLDQQVLLSDDVRTRNGVWSANDIKPGSSPLNAIIKAAVTIAGVDPKSLPKDYLSVVGGVLCRKEVTDVRAAVWQAVGVLTRPLPEFKRWTYPWDDPSGFVPAKEDPAYRLNVLYRDMVGFAYIHSGNKAAARDWGVSPSKAKFLEGLNLPIPQMRDTLRELSQWRSLRSNPWQCAARISAIWEPEK